MWERWLFRTRIWLFFGTGIGCLGFGEFQFLSVAVSVAYEQSPPLSLTEWKTEPPGFTGTEIVPGSAILRSGRWSESQSRPGRWAYLLSPNEHEHVALQATVTIRQAARQFGFFGESWSVWPDATFGDEGFEAAFVLRAGRREKHPQEFGYRVQFSHKYQQVAIVKYPDGGYLRSVPCEIKLDQPLRIEVSAQNTQLAVMVDGQEKIRMYDQVLPLQKGRIGLGVSSLAEVEFRDVEVQTLSAVASPDPKPHVPNFSVRDWLGGRPWVFDGDEPILLLPVPEAKYINNVKLRPGLKPQLSWNSHWGIENQGAYPAGENRNSTIVSSGGGKSLTIGWTARQTEDRFETTTSLAIGYDTGRDTYTYDVESKMTVLPGEPFPFRYGFDFEHHTPLDPFNWQYLVVRREGNQLNHRPVYPIDPGVMSEVEPYQGLRMWYGRHNEDLIVAPAVEYQIDPAWNLDPATGKPAKRPLNTAVCAAFYDTGVAFAQETLPSGTQIRVKYRYTGYPAEEARSLFESSALHQSPTLDPEHHYIFADEWPRLTFRKFKALSEPWWNERLPFMTGHNRRPTYSLARNVGVGSGFAMKLGPGAYGRADLPIPKPLPAGRYMLRGLCKSVNPHGPGGRIELTATDSTSNQAILALTHYVGNQSFDWKTIGFAFDLPQDAGGLSIALGNAGTGEVLFTDIEFQRWEAGVALPEGVLPVATAGLPPGIPSPKGAIADYRMEEGIGHHVFDAAGGPFDMLELANLGWMKDEGRPALQFADDLEKQRRGQDYPRAGVIDGGYFSHPAYAERKSVPVALAGHHGGGFEMDGLTISTWVKPAKSMGTGGHGGKGDVVGIGARRFILSLYGQESPYRLGARLNVNDEFIAEETKLEAGRWYHVVMTCAAEEGFWRVRLYLDGKQVHDGRTQKFAAPASIPPSLILGSELFYLHDAYYRGLIGRTLIFDKVLDTAKITELHQTTNSTPP